MATNNEELLQEVEITTKPLASDEHVDTRDFRVKGVQLIGVNGTAYDIASMCAEVQVRQDLYLGFMSGELLVTDGNDMHSRLGLHGGEYVFLHFVVPEQAIEIRKAFRVYKVSNRIPSGSMAQRYSIFFMSDELFTSYTTKISQAYTNSTVSVMAEDILKNHLKVDPKRLYIEPTGEAVSHIIPNWRPLEALNWLASRAYSGDTRNTFFFYENLEGFHFKSLQTIYKAGTRIKVPFTFEDKKGKKELDMDKFAIDSMESKRDFDILSTVASGGYAMRLITVDPVSRTALNNDYRLDAQTNSLYKNPAMSNASKLFEKTQTHLLAHLPYDGIEKWINRVMNLAILNNSLLEIVVPGNMGLEVGTLINIRVPYTVPAAEGDEMWDKRKSGKYLVIAVNHKFDMVNHKFTSLVNIARDSLPESLPPPDTKLSDRIKKLTS